MSQWQGSSGGGGRGGRGGRGGAERSPGSQDAPIRREAELTESPRVFV